MNLYSLSHEQVIIIRDALSDSIKNHRALNKLYCSNAVSNIKTTEYISEAVYLKGRIANVCSELKRRERQAIKDNLIDR